MVYRQINKKNRGFGFSLKRMENKWVKEAGLRMKSGLVGSFF